MKFSAAIIDFFIPAIGPQIPKTQSLYSKYNLILGFRQETVIVWDLFHCIFNALCQVKEG